MDRLSYRTLFTILLCALALACSSPPTGPEAAIQEFYVHLNEGHYTRAISLYDSEARKEFQDAESSGNTVFGEWARSETKDGEFDRVQIVEQETSDDHASVEFQIVYTDGTRVRRSVTLTRENGAWKLGFIS